MKPTKSQNRNRRHGRIRSRLSGTISRPRVTVFKSNRNVFVQVIDDTVGKTLISSEVKSAKKATLKGKKTEVAAKIGKIIGEKMKEKGITQAIFDRGGFKYHGRVKAVADALRESGIKI